jgi:hypothetical protein
VIINARQQMVWFVAKVRDNAVNQINVELSLEFKFVIFWLRILDVK